jgi:GT2 family glycosyltransferase
MSLNPEVCIIILNWNGKELLKDCLSSLFKVTDYPNYKVIVVDNGSTDGSVEYVKKNFPQVDVLPLDKNYGFAEGNNKGIKYALKKYKPKYILLLNNDTKIIQKDWLKKLVETAESDKKIGIVGPKLIYPDGRIQHIWTIVNPYRLQFFITNYKRGEKDSKKFSILKEVDALSAACVLIKKEVIEKIGLLDESFTPFWLEDTDFFIRAKNSGFKLIYNGKVKVVHFEGVSTKKYAKRKDLTENKNVFFIQRKNMLYFLLKHYGIKALLFQVPLILFDSVFSITYLKPRKDFLSRVLFIIHEVVKQIVNYSVSRGNYEVQ